MHEKYEFYFLSLPKVTTMAESKTRNEFSGVIVISGIKTNLHKTRRLVVKLEIRDNVKWHSEANSITTTKREKCKCNYLKHGWNLIMAVMGREIEVI